MEVSYGITSAAITTGTIKALYELIYKIRGVVTRWSGANQRKGAFQMFFSATIPFDPALTGDFFMDHGFHMQYMPPHGNPGLRFPRASVELDTVW